MDFIVKISGNLEGLHIHLLVNKEDTIMRIKGIGTVKKEEAMSILTPEGIEAVKNGDITLQDLGDMYKLEMTKRASKIGKMADTFRESFKWIPDSLKETLTPEELAKLTDRFYDCYSAGKAEK